MISYYIYGREKDGYKNYNPSYSEEDREHYFLKMAQYSACDNMDSQNQPQKIFFYQAQTKQDGLCTIIGQTSFVKMYQSIISGDRDTVFSFQYLLNGKEQNALFENPEGLYKFYPFPVDMDQMYSTNNGEAELTLNNAVFNPTEYIEKKKQNTETGYEYTIHELLQTFGLTEGKLEQFLYTFFLFNTQEKVYLMLPDNTKKYTEMAFELMRRIFSILPESFVRYNGFVTYVNKMNIQDADYIPYEIRYVFLSNTEDNKKVCENTTSNYVFYKECISGINIPDKLRKIIDDMKTALLEGHKSQELELLWTNIDNYLRMDMPFPVSLTEYDALYCLTQICILFESCSEKVSSKDIWDNLDIIWRMIEERAQLWDASLKRDIIRYMQRIIDSNFVDETDQYCRLFSYYNKIPEIQTSVENYFYRKVKDYDLLGKYMVILEPCADLKKKVYYHSIDMLKNLLQQGLLEEKLYATVIGLYDENDDLQDMIQNFFESKIENKQDLEKYKDLINSQKQELWQKIEQRVYANPDKVEFLRDAEIEYLKNIFAEKRNIPKVAMNDFWKRIMFLHDLNREILNMSEYCGEVDYQIKLLVSDMIRPMDMKEILKESQMRIAQLNLPQTYSNSFENISCEYLNKYTQRICSVCQDESIIQGWPYVSEDNADYRKIKKQLINKRMSEQYIREFERTINEKNILGIVTMFKSKSELVNAVQDSEKLDDYLRTIFNKLEKGVCASAKNNSAKDNYDKLCFEIVYAYPKKREKVYSYIMKSQYGGITAMGTLYDSLRKLRKQHIIEDNDMILIREQMAATIRIFFKNYKMSRQDKKAIKSEEIFLGSIGINTSMLLKKK